MSGRARIALWLGLAAGLAAGAPPARAGAVVEDPSCGVFALVQRTGTVHYGLPARFLRPGRDSVWSAYGALEPGVDYALDRTGGSLRLLREPAPGETLWVRACWLLDPPPDRVQLAEHRLAREPEAPAAGDSAASPPTALRPMTLRSTDVAPPGASLSFNGNKSIAIDFGSSQDAFLRQSLDLGVSGTIAPGVELTGVLSDRSTPLTAAGSTQDLQLVDRLLVELRAPQGGAALGDLSLVMDRGEFGRVERRIQGVRGDWRQGGVEVVGAAASSQGEYQRIQFFGSEGLQGPYRLRDRDGNPVVGVVPGSEIVTLDGVPLVRGESGDYAIDYDRGEITFSNRRPVSSASRITVEYQYALHQFRRNLVAGGTAWSWKGFRGHAQLISEGDDRGRPLGGALDVTDRYVLETAGDSAALAIAGGVAPGSGDYDRFSDSTHTFFKFAGRGAGDYAVSFSPVGSGAGDYADSVQVGGQPTYRFVGAGLGSYRVGRALPMPESHQLWTVGGSMSQGAMALDVEGAVSRLDRNTFSSFDDGDNLARAARAGARLEGGAPDWLGGTLGLYATARVVEPGFASFSRLEAPFVEEDWGLAPGADIEHQRRAEAGGFARPRIGGELRAGVGVLDTPDGFRSLRRTGEWTLTGPLRGRAFWLRSDGEQTDRRFPDGGRDRRQGELALALPWLEPSARVDWDERWSPSDTGRVASRTREIGGELRSPRALAWRSALGYGVRRDGALSAGSMADRSEARTARWALETPASGPLGAGLHVQRRELRGLADGARTVSDLAGARLRAADAARGLSGALQLEVTSEGETQRQRVLNYVGPGGGGYDSLGNYVGTGDYELRLELLPTLQQLARAATSARAGWQFGGSEGWRGSRVEFSVETDARRRGDLQRHDALISPGAALGDTALARGAVTQRLEADLAPSASWGAMLLRLERRVSADRAFTNFTQTLDERNATTRWRARPDPAWTTEVEGRWREQEATQAVGAARYQRALSDAGGRATVAFTPDPRLRLAASLDANWQRAVGAISEPTRTLRPGLELGASFASQGRVELEVRRALVSGAPALALLPSATPAGAPRWEANARLDYRVHASTTAGLSMVLREWPGRPVEHTGRAEVRAFF